MPTLPQLAAIKPVLKSRPFDHFDYLFELKYDGFRALAYIQDGRCEMVSRKNQTLRGFKALTTWLTENSNGGRDY